MDLMVTGTADEVVVVVGEPVSDCVPAAVLAVPFKVRPLQNLYALELMHPVFRMESQIGRTPERA